MKYLFLFISIMFMSLNLDAQAFRRATSIKCYACTPKDSVQTNQTIRVKSFSGLVIKIQNTADYIIQGPYDVTNSNNLFTFSNPYGKKITVDISYSNYPTANVLYEYLAGCVCVPDNVTQIQKEEGAPSESRGETNQNTFYQNTTTGSLYVGGGSNWQLLASGNVNYTTNIKVLLHSGGNVIGTRMKTELSDNDYLPIEEPYSDLGYEREVGGELITGSNDSITDWVLVELRDKSNPKLVRYSKAGLLHKNGSIKDLNSTSSLTFNDILEDIYYVSIKHRNHMGIMTQSPVDPSIELDFTTNTLPIWNPSNISNYRISLNSKLWLRSGKSNLAGLGTNFGLLSGYSEWEFDAENFSEGYYNTDYNLDRFVDQSDYSTFTTAQANLIDNGAWKELIPEFGKQSLVLLLQEMISTRSVLLSSGDSASQPAQAPEGSFRFNTTTNKMTVFVDGTGWVNLH